jgi:hypothetical protein
VSIFALSFGGAAVEVSIWSGLGAARAVWPVGLNIANEYGSGSGPVYVLSQSDDTGVTVDKQVLGIQMDSEFDIPTILAKEWGGTRWIGCNSQVYRVSTSMAIDSEIDLESKFNTFRLFSQLNRLVVLAEVSLFSLSCRGEINWRVDLDIVTAVRWERESVVISQMDGPDVRVDLREGSSTPL